VRHRITTRYPLRVFSAHTIRHLLVTALLGGVVFLCLAHTGSRLSRWTEERDWPAALSIPRFDWIGDRARDTGELGLVLERPTLEHEAGNELNLLLYRIQHAVVPSLLVRSPRERSVVVFAPGHERDASELRAEGWADAELATDGTLALVDRQERLRERPDARIRYRPTGIGTFFLLLIFLAPPLVAARRGWIPFGLTLIGTPCALGLAAAAGDAAAAVGSALLPPAPITLLFHIGLCALWIRAVTPLGAELDREPAPGGQAVGRKSFALAIVTTVLLGAALLVLFAGFAPEGGWDAQAMYNARARFVLLADGFTAPFVAAEGYSQLHPDYPPLIPFAVAGAWRLGDGLSPLAPLAVGLSIACGTALLVAAWAQRAGGRIAALTGLALLAVSPFWLERIAAQECDVPLASLFAAAIVTWRLGRMSTSAAVARRGAIVSGVLIGTAALVKNEGAVIALAWTFVVLLSALRRPPTAGQVTTGQGRPSGLRPYLAGLLPVLVLLGAFKWIAPTNDLVASFDVGRASWERAVTIGREVGPLLWKPQEFKSIFALVALPAAVTFVIGVERWWNRRRDGTVFEASLTVALALVAAAFATAYLITPYDLQWHVSTSASRLLTQLYPATVVLGLSAASRALRRPRPAGSTDTA